MQTTPPRKPIHRPFHIGLSVVVALVAAGGVYMSLRHLTASFANPPSAPAGKVWKQVWADEFNGSSVDGNKWNIFNNSNYGSSNSDDTCYLAKNATTSGGTLKLTARRETVKCGGTNPDGSGSNYYFTSGQVTTRAQGGNMKYKFKQGYIEARMKMPKGNPYWGTFWLVGPSDGSTPGWPDYGEFDISEIVGVRPDATFGTFHYKCGDSDGHCSTSPNLFNIKANNAYGGTSNLGTQLTSSSTYNNYSGGTTDFHNYGFLWEGNRITWYLDGRRVRFFDGSNLYRIEQNGSQTLEKNVGQMGNPSIAFSKVFAYDHSIILSLGVGGAFPISQGYTGKGTASGYSNGNLLAQFPSSMEVDYVRVFQLANAPASTPAPSPTPTPQPTPTPPANPQPSEEEVPADDETYSDEEGNGGEEDPTFVESTDGEQVAVAGNQAVVTGDTVLTPELATDKEVQESVAFVEYYVNDKLFTKVAKAPFALDTSKLADGTYNVEEKIHYKDGRVQARKAYIVVRNKKKAAAPVASAQKTKTTPLQVLGFTTAGVVVFVGLLFAFPPARHLLTGMMNRLLRRPSPL